MGKYVHFVLHNITAIYRTPPLQPPSHPTLTRIVSAEAHHHVAVVGHRNRVLQRRRAELPVQQTAPVQVQRVLQVDLLDGGVGRPAHADHVEGGAVDVERMAEVRLLDCRCWAN